MLKWTLNCLFCPINKMSRVTWNWEKQQTDSTCVSFEGGDQAAAVLLQLQDGHLTRLVSYKGMSGLHIEPGLRLRSRKNKLCSAEKLN